MGNLFIRRLQNITNLQASDCKTLEDLCQIQRKIPSKNFISRQGSEISTFPVLKSGWAARYQILRDGGRQITQILLPGDALYFGSRFQEKIIDEIIALSDCHIIDIAHIEIERAIDSSPAIYKAMRNYGCFENAILASWIVNLGRRDALERMAHFICELRYRLSLNDDVNSEGEFSFPLTQDDFADVLGLTPVHVNRKLQQLRQSELISLKSRKMRIIDLTALESVAGFNTKYMARQTIHKDRIPIPAKYGNHFSSEFDGYIN